MRLSTMKDLFFCGCLILLLVIRDGLHNSGLLLYRDFDGQVISLDQHGRTRPIPSSHTICGLSLILFSAISKILEQRGSELVLNPVCMFSLILLQRKQVLNLNFLFDRLKPVHRMMRLLAAHLRQENSEPILPQYTH